MGNDNNANTSASVDSLGGFNWRIETSLDYTPVLDSIETPSSAGPSKGTDEGVSNTRKIESDPVGLGLLSATGDDSESIKRGKLVAAYQSSRDEVFQEKRFCKKCGFLVKAFEHDKRCRTPSNVPFRVKQFAWIGDAIWEKFVRSWIVATGREFSEVSLYVTNERLAQFLVDVSQIVSLGCAIDDSSSIHTKATYVEAAIAVSGVVRQYVAKTLNMNIGQYDTNLWRGELVVSPEDDAVGIQPALDGYCYLYLAPFYMWSEISRALRAYPYWKQIKTLPVSDSYVRLYLKVVAGVAHISDVELPGMTLYTGDWRAIPFDDQIRVGGAKVDFTTVLEHNTIHDDWSDETRRLFSYVVREVRRARQSRKIALITSRCLAKIELLFQAPGTTVQVSTAKSGLNQVYNALVPSMALIERNVPYIATSGVLAFASMDDVDEMAAISESSALSIASSTTQ